MRVSLSATALIAAAGILVAGAAAAEPQLTQSHAERARGTLQRMDTNGDGVIDRSEAAAHPRMSAMFDRLDRNGDGRLDAGERPRTHGKDARHLPGPMIGAIRLDADGDGRVSRAEAADSRLAERFEAMDRNRDGYLVASELRDAGRQRRQQRSAQRQQQAQAQFAAADVDRDGKLSRAEVETAMPEMAKAFAFLDEDRDGFLLPADLFARP